MEQCKYLMGTTLPLYNIIRRWISSSIRLLIISYYENASFYNRTKLGVLWIPLSTFCFAITLTLVFGSKESLDQTQFFLYVLVGYSLWLFILETVTQSTTIIQLQIDFANHNRMNLIGLFFRNLFSRLFRHLLNVGALFLCALILSTDTVAISFLIYLPFLFIILLTSLGLSYLINFTTLVFPDSEKAVLIASRFLFFLSPIFWSADQGAGGIRNILVTYNPVSYYLSIARQIFYVEPFDSSKWIIAIGITLAICVSSYFCYLRTKDIVRNIS